MVRESLKLLDATDLTLSVILMQEFGLGVWKLTIHPEQKSVFASERLITHHNVIKIVFSFAVDIGASGSTYFRYRYRKRARF